MCLVKYGNYWWVVQAPTNRALVTPLFFMKIKFEEFKKNKSVLVYNNEILI
jgi:hypothetical protein